MAVVSTSVSLEEIFFPWDSPHSVPGTAIPVGEFVFNARDVAIDGAGAGDSQQADINCNLPVNFAYALTEVSASIDVTGAAGTNNWELVQFCILHNTKFLVGGSQTMEYAIRFESPGEYRNVGVGFKSWSIGQPQMPKFLSLGGSLLAVKLSDLTLDDLAAKLNFTARFLQYTLDQIFDVEVNAAILTR